MKESKSQEGRFITFDYPSGKLGSPFSIALQHIRNRQSLRIPDPLGSDPDLPDTWRPSVVAPDPPDED